LQAPTATTLASDRERTETNARADNHFLRLLKAFAHRQRFIAALLASRRQRRLARAFEQHLAASIGTAVQWHAADEPLSLASDIIARLQRCPEPPPRKGSPSIVGIRAHDVTTLARSLSARAPFGAAELAAAARIASLEPANLDAFKLYLAALWLSNAQTIARLRATCTENIALHMTCAPRLARADRSIDSFRSPGSLQLTHVKLIGIGAEYEFDSRSAVLGVPSSDAYQSLPQKVFQGLALLTLACNPRCVLKLDDDHRLADAGELGRILKFASRTNEALQLGEVNRVPLPSAHHRAWHFGKCGDAPIGSQVLAMPTPLEWAAGSAGYVLNRAALWRVLWSSLYYARWLDEIVYEDIALAEAATKTGIRIVRTDMRRALAAVTEY
jgi:hypothetical protein